VWNANEDNFNNSNPKGKKNINEKNDQLISLLSKSWMIKAKWINMNRFCNEKKY
jgi:hypothetical protein